MQTLPLIGSGFNPDVPAPLSPESHDGPAGRFAAVGHADELSIAGRGLVDGPPAQQRQELIDGLAESEIDQHIQRADEAHAGELRAAYRRAKELAGPGAVSVSRRQLIDDDIGRLVERTQWSCTLAHGKAVGLGASGDEAVRDAIGQLDNRYGIARAFSGYRVPGRGVVFGFPARTLDEALALARRIAADAAYLDECLELKLDGIRDERASKPAPRPGPQTPALAPSTMGAVADSELPYFVACDDDAPERPRWWCVCDRVQMDANGHVEVSERFDDLEACRQRCDAMNRAALADPATAAAAEPVAVA